MSEDNNAQWICSTIDAPGGERVQGSPTKPVSMGMAARGLTWAPHTKLKVRFLEGVPALHNRVLEAAREWIVDGVKFSIELAAPGEKAHIRIAFNAARGSWSYIGKDCLGIHPSQPTMNLGWATLQTPKRDFYSVVIHEWGHALGLLHEHNHPEALIDWDRQAVIDDLSAPPNEWDLETIESNVFAQYKSSQVITTDFDKASVMIYTIPSRWTKNGKSFMPSWKLSDGDRATIVKLYQ